jgi:hypothetical protein
MTVNVDSTNTSVYLVILSAFHNCLVNTSPHIGMAYHTGTVFQLVSSYCMSQLSETHVLTGRLAYPDTPTPPHTVEVSWEPSVY